MTRTQCENIKFHNVGMGYQDTIMYLDGAERALTTENHKEVIKGCVQQSRFIGATTANVRRTPDAHLTIVAKAGVNAFVVSLAHLMKTTFVENAPPILSLASAYPPFAGLISEVTLYYIGPNDVVVAQGGKEGYAKPKGFAAPKWASFVVDTNAPARNAARDGNTPVEGNGLQIPLHFNLYNEVFDMPNWLAANHQLLHGEGGHGHIIGNKVHGGPHPDNPRNYVEVDLGP